jgi:two-component system, OmpR family, response regulator
MKKRILVIDDNLAILDLLQSLLQGIGYEVMTTTDGRSALELIKIRRPDLILLDVFMPIMSGYEFIEHFRQQDQAYESIPIMLITAQQLPLHEIKRLEVAGYLQKPFHLKELLNKISGLLGLSDAIPIGV